MTDAHDPKGLIREAYRIDGISTAECRTIFLDWALGVPEGADTRKAVMALLALYQHAAKDHPMTQTLEAALADQASPKRRGGRAGRMNS
ncbi:MAG: hypothetical protein AAFP85_00195 [Pseudomonadota bacterium]